VFGARQQRFDCPFVAEIGRDRNRGATLAADHLDQFLGCGTRTAVVNRDGKAVLGEG
jgi:hypothetical protein